MVNIDRIYSCVDPQLSPILTQAVKQQDPSSQLQEITLENEQLGVFRLRTTNNHIRFFRPQMTGMYDRNHLVGFSEADIANIASQIAKRDVKQFICSCDLSNMYATWWDANDPFTLDQMKKCNIAGFFQSPDSPHKITVTITGTNKKEINTFIDALRAERKRLYSFFDVSNRHMEKMKQLLLQTKMELNSFLTPDQIRALAATLENCFGVPFAFNEDLATQFAQLALGKTHVMDKLLCEMRYDGFMHALNGIVNEKNQHTRMNSIIDEFKDEFCTSLEQFGLYRVANEKANPDQELVESQIAFNKHQIVQKTPAKAAASSADDDDDALLAIAIAESLVDVEQQRIQQNHKEFSAK